MRKILLRCYSLWKNDCAYDPHDHPAHYLEKEVTPTSWGVEATQDEPIDSP